MRPPPPRRSSSLGFTLLEMMVTVAIAGILATMAYSYMRSTRRNVGLRQASGDIALRLRGLRATALSEGQDYLFVVTDAPGNDSTGCNLISTASCTRYFVLQPQAGWTLSAFAAGSPGTNATLVDSDRLPRGARFYMTTPFRAPPPPFAAVPIFGTYLGTCAGGLSCFAIRFTLDGKVMAESTAVGGGQSPATVPGFAFALGTDADLESAGADHRGVLVSFPTGVVKTWAY